MMNNLKLSRLKGKLQHYQWGGTQFLPALLNQQNPDQKPSAEYWLGAHVNAPADVEGAQPSALDAYLSKHPEQLGSEVQSAFGRLPYLLKVLDVKDMLSIQVHPSKSAAAIEFQNENRKGIALTAPNRNYKDDNHKPELMVALSEFWLLHGFKSKAEIARLSQSIPEFAFMFAHLEEGGYRGLYKHIMEEDQDRINRILDPLLHRIVPAYEAGKLAKDNPDFWAARAALTYNEPELIDRGIFSVYLLNLVHLKEGEAIFQDAGVLHAYLEGQNMEIMANSDNVLRGGLTPKHVDVKELMKHVTFEEVVPHVIKGSKRTAHEEVYVSPAPDFELSRIHLKKSETENLNAKTTEIFLTMQGEVILKENEVPPITLKKGEAAIAFNGASLRLEAMENTVVFRAAVPAKSK